MIYNFEDEAWVPVYQSELYSQPYKVSNYGRVCNTRSGRFLKPDPVHKGHLRITLHLGKHRGKQYLISRLVLLSFVGPEEGKPRARHRNGIPGDNRLTNLCWSTFQEVADMRDWKLNHHRKGDNQSNAKLTWGQVNRLRDLHKQGIKPKQLDRMFPEITPNAIRRVLYRRGSWDLTQKEQRAVRRHQKKLLGALNDTTIQTKIISCTNL